MKFNILICLVLLAPLFASGETMELTNTEGKKIKVFLVESKDGQVSFRFPGKRAKVSVALDQLDQKSQNKIKIWKLNYGQYTRKLALENYSSFKNKTSRSTDGFSNSYSQGYSKERKYSITPKIKIRNKDMDYHSIPGTIQFYLFPGSRRGPQTIKLPPIAPNKTIELEGKPVTYVQSESSKSMPNSTGGMTTITQDSGSGYQRYAFYVVSDLGEILLERATRKEELEKYRPKSEVERDGSDPIRLMKHFVSKWKAEDRELAILRLEESPEYEEKKNQFDARKEHQIQVVQRQLEILKSGYDKYSEELLNY